jgi:transposase-like protein
MRLKGTMVHQNARHLALQSLPQAISGQARKYLRGFAAGLGQMVACRLAADVLDQVLQPSSSGVTQKAVWFMVHRIRLSMRNGEGSPLSGEVEGDTTGIGGKEKNKHASKRIPRGTGNVGRAVVFGLLARHGHIRAKAVPNEQAETLQGEIRRNVESGAIIYTDEAAAIRGLYANYAHEVINHSEEYVRGAVHTYGIESFWTNFKRTIYGTHHFVMPWQLDRYLNDTTLRFNQRKIEYRPRVELTLAQTDGRRSTYRELTGSPNA